MLTLDDIFDAVKTHSPLALVRYGDGELSIMRGKRLLNAEVADQWSVPEGLSALGKKLRESFSTPLPGFFRGIPACSNCAWDWGRNMCAEFGIGATVEECACACVFIHERWSQTLAWVNALDRPVVVVCGEHTDPSSLPCDVDEALLVSAYAPAEFFDSARYAGLIRDLSEMKNQLILLSAGPLAAAIAWDLWQINRTNIILDIGSAIDHYLHGRPTRPFMDVQDWSGRECRFGDVEL